MLILSRKENEQIVLLTEQGTVSIQVCSIGRNRVRIGVEADSRVLVVRAEILERSEYHETSNL